MTSNDNVVARLKQRLRDAKLLGLKVRMELLDDEHASWCEIAGMPTLFVDLSQTAAEQLKQVEETLAAYLAAKRGLEAGSPKTDDRRADTGLPRRAA